MTPMCAAFVVLQLTYCHAPALLRPRALHDPYVVVPLVLVVHPMYCEVSAELRADPIEPYAHVSPTSTGNPYFAPADVTPDVAMINTAAMTVFIVFPFGCRRQEHDRYQRNPATTGEARAGPARLRRLGAIRRHLTEASDRACVRSHRQTRSLRWQLPSPRARG
jgi:hypothetical protein